MSITAPFPSEIQRFSPKVEEKVEKEKEEGEADEEIREVGRAHSKHL